MGHKGGGATCSGLNPMLHLLGLQSVWVDCFEFTSVNFSALHLPFLRKYSGFDLFIFCPKTIKSFQKQDEPLRKAYFYLLNNKKKNLLIFKLIY